ncbi:MAG: cohesin domain-containing protein, partial [Saprospiraceae bacterium]
GTNSCWSRLIIEDKIKPVIVCSPVNVTLSCVEMASYKPTITEACGILRIDSTETITPNNCLPGNGFHPSVLKRIVRTYIVTDIHGNTSLPCTTTFEVTTLASLDSPTITYPENYDIAPGMQDALQCNAPYPKLDNGNPSPVSGTVSGVVRPGTGTPKLGAVDLFNNQSLYCGLLVTYTDAPPIKINCVTKIMRTWQVFEWSCLSRMPITKVQVLEIVDSKGPTVTGLKDILASTSNHVCEANVNLAQANAVFFDSCSATTTYTVNIKDKDGLAVVSSKQGNSRIVKLSVGSYTADYIVYDECYNSTTVTINILVEDNTPPVAICDELATIGLTNDGTAWVPATVFDDGSYDECSLAKVLVRRMTPNCGPCVAPTYPGFDLIGERGTGTAKRYYYLSRHAATSKVANKTAVAIGGYLVLYSGATTALVNAERDTVRIFVHAKAPNLSFFKGTSTGGVEKDQALSGPISVPLATDTLRYVVEIENPCGWSAYAPFCCADVAASPRQMVAFRAIDDSGNFNDCMVSVEIQDKIGPKITCPADRTVFCDFAYDPANLAKDFGSATVTDNCTPLPVVVETVNYDSLTQCRIGFIKRKFKVTDVGGRSDSCTQTIRFLADPTKVYTGPTTAQWPAAKTINGCGNPADAAFSADILGRPILTDGVCSLVGASQYEDEVYQFNNSTSPACFKILRKWTVIDWCKFAPNTYINVSGGISMYPSSKTEGVNSWTWTQEIKVNDLVAPVFKTLAPTVSVNTTDGACANGSITLTASAKDNCTKVMRATISIDSLNNGTIDRTSLPTPTIGVLDTNTVSITLNYPVGTHKIIFSFEDKCGNLTSKEQIFTIVNTKAPSAYVKKGLAMSIMKISEGVGSATIWAKDFDNGSNHPCGYPVLLSFTPVTVSKGLLVGTTSLSFNCDELGENEVIIYVAALTPMGNVVQSSVETTINIQDNGTPKICPNLVNGDKVSVKGLLATESNDQLEAASINLIGSELSKMTDKTGTFAFSNMSKGGNYTVTPDKNDDHMNGVSTLDLVMIQRHILGIDKLTSPYKQIAADVNKDGKISASDLLELRKLILGTTVSFANNKSWRFVDKVYKFNDATFAQGEAFPEVYNINDLKADMVTDFVAVKVGDVNGNVKANNFAQPTESRSNEKLVLTTDNIKFDGGQKIVVPVKVASNASIAGLQFTLNFDRDKLALVGVDPIAINVNDQNFGFNDIANGVLTASWNDVRASKLNASQTLFNLTFVAKDKGDITSAIQVNSTVTSAEAYDNDGSTMAINWKVVDRTANDQFTLYQNAPNPFKESTMIGFELPSAMVASITVYDVTGKVVKVANVNGNKGYNSVDINKNDVGTGVMYYTLKAGEYTATRKMVVIE